MARLATRRHSHQTNSATQNNGAGPSDLHNQSDAQDASNINSIGTSQSQPQGAQSTAASNGGPLGSAHLGATVSLTK